MEYLASGRHFHLSSLFLHRSLQPALPGIFRELKSAGLSLSLDTNDDPEGRWQGVLDELLQLVDIFLPNESEAMQITATTDAESAAAVLAERVPLVVIKCGKRGAFLRSGQQQWIVPGTPVSPKDSIGAGDSFNAGFLSAWLRGKPPEACAAFGNRTAALSMSRSGGTEAFRNQAMVNELFEEA
jgi:sugar/nucleoside kinase (ribokinase family)